MCKKIKLFDNSSNWHFIGPRKEADHSMLKLCMFDLCKWSEMSPH